MEINEIHKFVIRGKFKDLKKMVKQYHYLGDKSFRNGYIYMLIVDKIFKGGLVWHQVSAPETIVGMLGLEREEQEGVFELGRLVLTPDLNHTNIASWFVAQSIKMLKKDSNEKVKALLTYVDSTYHVGTVYQALSFKYYGLTDPKIHFWVNGKIQERGRTKNVEGEWKPRSRKHRYLMILDRKYKKLLKWKEQPYPKGDKKNHIETKEIHKEESTEWLF